MHDMKYIRQNPHLLDAMCLRRGLKGVAQELLAQDQTIRTKKGKIEELLKKRHELSAQVKKLLDGAGDFPNAQEAMESLKAQIVQLKIELLGLEEALRLQESVLHANLLDLPNFIAADTPCGEDESYNVIQRYEGKIPQFSFEPKAHDSLELKGLDFQKSSQISGSRYCILRGGIARLHRALGQFMMDLHTQKHGYQEIITPVIVKEKVLRGTGQLPKFKEDLFCVSSDQYLIPTAEVTLTNLVREEILAVEDFPLRFTALTQCFRKEAGAGGRDIRGLMRQHQFEKVELVSIVEPEKSDDELYRMLGCAEEVLKQLDLAYRVVRLCEGDVGFSAYKTYDLDVWLPGQGCYREISSCSNTQEFQARRMQARYKKKSTKKLDFVHTLNGSGLAIGRTLIAILENYQQEKGSICVPSVLRPYMGNKVLITGEEEEFL